MSGLRRAVGLDDDDRVPFVASCACRPSATHVSFGSQLDSLFSRVNSPFIVDGGCAAKDMNE